MLQSEVLGSPRGLNECDFYHLLRSHWTSKGSKTPFQVPHDPQKYWALDLATQPGRTDVTESVTSSALETTSELLSWNRRRYRSQGEIWDRSISHDRASWIQRGLGTPPLSW